MTRFIRYALVLGLGLWCGRLWAQDAPDAEPESPDSAAPAVADDEFAPKATWQEPTAADLRIAAFNWLKDRQADDAVKAKAEALWPADEKQPPTGAQLLERAVSLLALGDSQARELVEFCSHPRTQVVLPKFEWLADEKLPAFERNNLRLLYSRWLSQERLYDESLHLLAGLEPADVADPASLLFYQSVGYHALLEKEPGLQTLDRLLQRRGQIPRRYETVAKLMQSDLSGLKDESLDHISRQMNDIKRRLDLGRTGKKVRTQEDDVIAELDKMIDKIEQQQQQEQQQQGAGGMGRGGQAPIAPAQDSRPLQGKGPGEVAKKKIGNQSGWGDLPPKEREEALQQIGKEFPAHYRDIIEQYFRERATENNDK